MMNFTTSYNNLSLKNQNTGTLYIYILVYGAINIVSMNTENYVTIRTYHDHIMGEIMISALSNAGIRTFKFDELSNVTAFDDTIEIKVHESDVDAALEIIEAREAL